MFRYHQDLKSPHCFLDIFYNSLYENLVFFLRCHDDQMLNSEDLLTWIGYKKEKKGILLTNIASGNGNLFQNQWTMFIHLWKFYFALWFNITYTFLKWNFLFAQPRGILNNNWAAWRRAWVQVLRWWPLDSWPKCSKYYKYDVILEFIQLSHYFVFLHLKVLRKSNQLFFLDHVQRSNKMWESFLM